MSVKPRAGNSKMNATAIKVKDEGRLCVATAAGDRGWDDTRQTWLARAASRLGLSYSRVFNIWYGRARLYADELEEMRAKITELKWRQRRHEDRLNEVANRIQALAGDETSRMERGSDRLDGDGPSGAAGTRAAAPHEEP